MAAPPKDLAVQPLANKAPTSYLEEACIQVVQAGGRTADPETGLNKFIVIMDGELRGHPNTRIHHCVPKTTSTVFSFNRKFVGTHILGVLVVASSGDRSAHGQILQGGITQDFIKMNLQCLNLETDFYVTVYTACAPQSVIVC